jgi:hypothetical protein
MHLEKPRTCPSADLSVAEIGPHRTPCHLRLTSGASKNRLVDWHPLYVSAPAAPHVCAAHYSLEFEVPHGSREYDQRPKITAGWQTRIGSW